MLILMLQIFGFLNRKTIILVIITNDVIIDVAIDGCVFLLNYLHKQDLLKKLLNLVIIIATSKKKSSFFYKEIYFF